LKNHAEAAIIKYCGEKRPRCVFSDLLIAKEKELYGNHLCQADRALPARHFNVLDEKEQKLQAAGRTIYNLSIGTPDFLPEPHVTDALARAAQDPDDFKYALHDLPELISAVQEWYRRRYGVELAPEEIMPVYGSQEGMAHIALALCDSGDIVLVPNRFEMGPFLCGARPVCYDLLPKREYLPDQSAIPAETADAARFMVVSPPANPVGAVADDAFYRELIAFARRHDIILLHDNAYSEIIFDGRVGGSFLAYPGAMEVGVEFNSLSKTYNLTDARISFVLGNREIVSRFRTVRSQIDYGIFLQLRLRQQGGGLCALRPGAACGAHPGNAPGGGAERDPERIGS